MKLYEIVDIEQGLLNELENVEEALRIAKTIENPDLRDIQVAHALSAKEVILEMMVINKDQLNEKAIAYCRVNQNLQADISSIDAEIHRLQKLKKTKVNQSETLLERFKYSLDLLNVEKLDLGTFKVSFRNSCSVQVKEEMLDQIPEEYINTKVEKKPNKKLIKGYLKTLEGLEKPFPEYANLNYKRSLQIK